MTISSTRRRWVSLADAADHLGLHERTIRRMIAAGELTGYRFGTRIIRLDLDELDALLHQIPAAG